MPLTVNSRVIFSAVPVGNALDGVLKCLDDETIDIENVPLNGGILVKVIALSLDPYMRNRMRPVDEVGDMPPFELGSTISGFAVGAVVRTELAAISVGQHVYGFMPFMKYAIFASEDSDSLSMPGLGLEILENTQNLPWHYFLGILGMPGQTAFYGLKEISSPKKGDTIFVSAAAGAVGHLVVQYAKNLGLKVIASCGSDAKVQIVRDLGADHVFNYKTSDVAEELAKHGPIDIYFDNVGGPTLESAIANANEHARFVLCGMVSQYNAQLTQSYGIRNLWLVQRYRIKMEGFRVTDWHTQYLSEFKEVVPSEIAAGKVKYLCDLYQGLENTSTAFISMLNGLSTGKVSLIVDAGV